MSRTVSGDNIRFKGIRPVKNPFGKLAGHAKSLAFSTPLYNLTLIGGSPDDLQITPTDPWPGRSDIGQDIMNGLYQFAGERIEMTHPVFEPQGGSDEWVAEFSRFDWLRDLKAVSTGDARVHARRLISDWIDSYDRWHKIIWRSDVLGARLSNWIGAFSFYGLSADDDFQTKVRLSIAKQTRHLARVINDGHVDSVQSFSALKGLIYAMIAIGSPKSQLEHPFHLVLEQIQKQILVDGGHISRSPIVLAQVLMILIDLRTVLNVAKLPVPEQIQFAIDKIVPTLRFFRYADGNLAHFNGGYEWDASLIDCILNLSGARGRPVKRLEQSGYSKLRLGRSHVLIDSGMPVDQNETRTAHAAPLSFEFCFGRDRIFTNCGAVSKFGQWHDALRATAAHTTLTIDQRNACPMNDAGYFSGMPEVTSNITSSKEHALFDGTHTGYKARYGITHRRKLLLKDSGQSLIGEDSIRGGGIGVPYAVRFHLHPSSQASLVQSESAVLIQTKSRTGWRFQCRGGETIHLEESVYIGRRGHIRRTQHIVVRGLTKTDPTQLKWGITRILA